MKEAFFETRTRQQVLDLVSRFRPVGTETIAAGRASGRVLSADITASCDVPHFNRATMDGYVVKAEDVSRCSPETPVTLRLIGWVEMGQPAGCVVERGTAVEVATGAALPDGADAVVMLEYTERLPDGTISVTRPVARYENIARTGADFEKGHIILRSGKRIAPKDVAALLSVGAMKLDVYKKPVAAIISTGDELVPPEEKPGIGQIRETNSAVLAALIERDSGVPVPAGIAQDELSILKKAIEQAMQSADMVLMSGGSSVGARDLTLTALESFHDSEILVHGIATRPGKPTIVASIGGKPVIGLPGHPVSSLVSYEVVVKPILDQLSGCSRGMVHGRSGSTVKARLQRRLPALVGRDEYVRVKLEYDKDGLVAVPLGRSSWAMSTLADADGWILVDMNTEGIEAADEVEVTLF
jgi:molybdopterin molybdotransferase